MKLTESLLAACVLGLAGFIGVQSYDMRGTETRAEAAGAIDTRQLRGAAAGKAASRKNGAAVDAESRALDPSADAGTLHETVTLPDGDLAAADSEGASMVLPAAPARLFSDASTVRERRRRISLGAPGTYIGELLASRDSALARWPDRTARPLRVWVDETSRLPGWNADFTSAVRDAFSTWSESGIPVRFDFVRDSASADVHVRFTEQLANGISGKTVWSRDANWWLVSSDIALALVHPSGGNVTPPQMRAIALHEVGHLLGLDHADSPDNIMSARVRVRELSDADKATAMLLYSVPAGTLKQR